jgi:hypothetical protein
MKKNFFILVLLITLDMCAMEPKCRLDRLSSLQQLAPEVQAAVIRDAVVKVMPDFNKKFSQYFWDEAGKFWLTSIEPLMPTFAAGIFLNGALKNASGQAIKSDKDASLSDQFKADNIAQLSVNPIERIIIIGDTKIHQSIQSHRYYSMQCLRTLLALRKLYDNVDEVMQNLKANPNDPYIGNRYVDVDNAGYGVVWTA